ncbi:MAG: hypothetical protein QMC28_07700 [Flavobacteriales bacterium]
MKKSLLSIGIATLLFVGCVPARKYEDLKAKNEQCQKELAKFQTENEQFKTENTELSQMLATKKSELVTANEEMEGAKRKFLEKEQQYDKLKQLHDDILLRYNRLLANSSIENKTLSSKLDKSQKELQDKEDQLNIL